MDRFRAMEFFLSVSQTRNFTETAHHYGVSPTSVSRVIGDLEEQLNTKLLLRSTRHIDLTEAGLAYAQQIEGILWSVREIHENISAISATPRGLLRVNSRVMFGHGVLTPLIAHFGRHFPDIQVELFLSESKADLRRQNVDIDFRISPPVEAGIKRRRLFLSHRYLVATKEYLQRKPEISRPDDLLSHDCLAYYLPGDSYIWRFKNEDNEAEIQLNPRHISNNGTALLELARMGEGIALLDDYTVATDLEEGRLVRLLPDYRVTNTSFEEGIFVTFLDTPIIPAKIRAFIDFVAGQVAGEQRRFSQFRTLKI